jgi:hypothetical protein
MKKYVYTIVYMLAVMYAGANAALIVTNLTGVPANDIYVQQTNVTANMQTRYQTGSNWRSAVQTFSWTTDNPLNGVGLYVTNIVQTAAQTYTFSIQELSVTPGSPNSSNTVVSTVFNESFTMSAATVSAGEWLYLDLGLGKAGLDLKNGKNYCFVIGPATNAANIVGSSTAIYFGTSGTTESYTGGGSAQPTGFASGFPYDDGTGFFTANARDLTFFMTSIPEPSTVGLFVVSMCSVFGLRRIMM